ncbi:MAG: aspartate aminotransferase family protein, partial [Nitrospirae bacterium]|nr:aspartate aminotransferase family protein [Nitrospirota bacterium]
MENDLRQRARGFLSPALVIHTNILIKKARGIYVEDVDGRRYMDFTSGLATTNTGHNHPKVVEAIKRQAEAFIHSGCMFYYEPLANLPEMLKKVTPPGLDMFFFSNSGAEAVEGAIKLARLYTERQGIIAFSGAFHGRTFGAASLTTSNMRYRRNYHPFLPSVYHSPYPYCYRCYLGQRPETCSMECYEYLERLFKYLVPPEEVACIIIEPVLGEGGYVVPPLEFLRNLRVLCERWGILLILDEVQSGMGRTGRWFASEHSGIVPDIMTVAKGIASGMPLSAVVSKKEIMSRWPPGSHGTTFGGNPVSCAAAIATLEVIEEEGLLGNAMTVGNYAMEILSSIKERNSCIGDVRGLGLMIGIEFVKDGKEPYTEGLKKIMG